MKSWLDSQPLTRSRYWLGRQLRALAKHVEPTVAVNWEREAALYSTVTMTNVTTTWPIEIVAPRTRSN